MCCHTVDLWQASAGVSNHEECAGRPGMVRLYVSTMCANLCCTVSYCALHHCIYHCLRHCARLCVSLCTAPLYLSLSAPLCMAVCFTVYCYVDVTTAAYGDVPRIFGRCHELHAYPGVPVCLPQVIESEAATALAFRVAVCRAM